MTSAQNKSLLAISVVAVVNALGYGIIIPIQYSYVERFGINAFWLGVLFASYSLAQFLSTPVIGRLSDRYGRKPLLLYSVLGTAGSFLLLALAHSIPLIFLARILDGITGGNISVAQAVISDSTEPKERAKWFGVLGASFGFGFVFGPAIGGILSGIDVRAPFYFAAAVSVLAAALVAFLLKETLVKSHREHKPVLKLFDLSHLYKALFEPYVGLLLMGTFIITFAFAIFILGFQTFTNDILKLTPTGISLLFAMFGVIGLLMQGFVMGKLVAIFKEIPLFIAGVIITALSFFGLGLSSTLVTFAIAAVALAIGNSLIGPIITSLISKHTKKEDQGGIMGVNQSYMSLANIVGPIIGGILATSAVHDAFFGAGIIMVVMILLSLIISREHGRHVVDL